MVNIRNTSQGKVWQNEVQTAAVNRLHLHSSDGPNRILDSVVRRAEKKLVIFLERRAMYTYTAYRMDFVTFDLAIC